MIFIHLFMLFPRQAMEGIPFKGQRVAAETKSTELCCPVLPIELYEHTVSFRFLFYLLEVTRLFPPAQIVSTMKVTAFSAVNTPDNVGGSCLKISQMHFKKKKIILFYWPWFQKRCLQGLSCSPPASFIQRCSGAQVEVLQFVLPRIVTGKAFFWSGT